MRKPKTPLLSLVQRTLSKAWLRERHGENLVAEIEASQAQHLATRREFLAQSLGSVTAASGVLLATQNSALALGRKAAAPNIAIVGGGIAGLNAAYQLRKRFGLPATVYEGSAACGGRIKTKDMGAGLTAELGGEFIDTGHEDLRNLAKEFGLEELDNVEKGLIKDSYFFGGQHYTEEQVILAFSSVVSRIKADAEAVDKFGTDSLQVRKLDYASMAEYLEKIGVRSWFYDLLDAAFTGEFGLEIGRQSSLNFLTMIGTDTSGGEFKVYGESDERFKIKGGNGQLITKLAGKLEGQIETSRKLEAIRQKGGKFVLSFASGKDVPADLVVLALPFSVLRETVDFKGLALGPKKRKAITELGYGTNAKLLLNVSSRVWREQHRVGYLFSKKVQNGWDYSQGQKGNTGPGGYTVYLGGEAGRTLQCGQEAMYVAELDAAFPNFKNTVNGTEVVNWFLNPFTNGSYSCYKPGQWTEIAGAEFAPQGNLY